MPYQFCLTSGKPFDGDEDEEEDEAQRSEAFSSAGLG